jgi:FkbM family methyltransferase
MKVTAKRFLAKLGLDVRLARNLQQMEKRTWEQRQNEMWHPFLAHHRIRTVIDIGANDGQFATLAHRLCPEARVISFEPLPSCHSALSNVLKEIPGSLIKPYAVGDKPGTAKLNASEFSPCSSLLTGTELLGEDYSDAAKVKTIQVPVVRVDDALRDDSLDDDILVKFDVQGYEIPAMQGAEELLKKASIVVCEVCFFRKLYDGQPLFDEVYRDLFDRGFRYMGNAEQSLRKSDGRVVEADAIFERSK